MKIFLVVILVLYTINVALLSQSSEGFVNVGAVGSNERDRNIGALIVGLQFHYHGLDSNTQLKDGFIGAGVSYFQAKDVDTTRGFLQITCEFGSVTRSSIFGFIHPFISFEIGTMLRTIGQGGAAPRTVSELRFLTAMQIGLQFELGSGVDLRIRNRMFTTVEKSNIFSSNALQSMSALEFGLGYRF